MSDIDIERLVLHTGGPLDERRARVLGESFAADLAAALGAASPSPLRLSIGELRVDAGGLADAGTRARLAASVAQRILERGPE